MLKIAGVVRKLAFFLVWLPFGEIHGQKDTIISYNVSTKTIDTILPVPVDTTIVFDHTSASFGSNDNSVSLSLSPPSTNLFMGSQFSDIERAELFFNVTDYPVRTAVNLFSYDSLKTLCSGIIVSQNMVLTSAHCVKNFTGIDWIEDRVLAVPAFDNGDIYPSMPTSLVDKYYILKSFYEDAGGVHSKDIALLRLEQPIGVETGWIGIAFSADTNYFSEKVFHKFSYPGVTSPFDSTKKYNGDTLYYNYGYIDVLPYNGLGIMSSEAKGIQGQSGSSFMYTNNNSEYYTFGVFNWSSNYRHYRITRNDFYQLKNVIDINRVELVQDTCCDSTKIFPNPFTECATLEINNQEGEAHNLNIFDRKGKLVQRIENITTEKIEIKRKNLNAGIYFLQLTSDKNITTVIKLVIL